MCPVTERAIIAVLAAAEIDRAALFSGVRSRGEGTSLMGSVAERLRGALAAGAPIVGFTLFNIDGNGGFLSNDGFGHGFGGVVCEMDLGRGGPKPWRKL